MQIHSINNKNNNPNFKQLYVTKQTLKQIGHTRGSLLEIPELRNLSQVYDVRVSQGFRDWDFNIIEKGFFREKEHCGSRRADELTNRESMHRLKYFSLDGFSKSNLKKILSRIDEDGNNALHGLLRFSSGLIDKVSNATTDFKSLILMKNKNGETPLDSLDGESVIRIFKHLNLSPEEIKELQLKGPSLMETISESLLKDSRTFEDGVKYLSKALGEEETRKITRNYINRLVTDENFFKESILDNSVKKCQSGLILTNVTQNVIKGLVFVNDIESINKLFEEKKQIVYDLSKEFPHWSLCSCIEPLLASNDSEKIKKLLADIMYDELTYQHQHSHDGMTDLHSITYRDDALKYLKNSPEKLAKALMMKNHDKETPFHIHWRDSQFVSEIIIALKDMPSELKTILTMPSQNPESSLNLSRYITDEKLQPILATALGEEYVKNFSCREKEFLNLLATTDLSDANNVLDILSNYPLIQESKGAILHTPYNENGDTLFFDIANLIPTEENQDCLSQIASIMSKLYRLNYSKIDKMGMTFFKIILWTENLEFLKLFSDKTITYEPVLDNIYNNISNEEIKNYVKSLDIIFPDTIKTLKGRDWSKFVNLRKQFQSPLYDKNKHGMQIIKAISPPPDHITFDTIYAYVGEEYLPERKNAISVINSTAGCIYPLYNYVRSSNASINSNEVSEYESIGDFDEIDYLNEEDYEYMDDFTEFED